MAAVPLGFKLAGVHCGIKPQADKLDLSLIVSDPPATAAGVYTQNLVFGAPVKWDRARTPGRGFRAVVVNSGNSNACTGERGDRDAAEMARLAGQAAGGDADSALVMSTGVIGRFLPMETIAAGIAAAAKLLGDDEQAIVNAAQGMMTTDTVPKISGRAITLRGRTVHLLGLAKGAAMIGPNMATMLSVILTDAALEPETAQDLLFRAADDSFNCISVEGHTSTSDTVLLLANGAACASPPLGEDLAELQAALKEVCVELATAIVNDGEGATHVITIDVAGCASRAAAHAIAKAIANSPLVKTAIHGGDPNWGRIVSAAGYAGIPFNPAGVDLKLNGLLVYERGAPAAFDNKAVSKSIRDQRETHVAISFREGTHGVRFWTTDLTAEYVHLNADYTT